MGKRDRAGQEGGKNRLEAYVEIAESTCNFRQSGSQPEEQLRQTPEKGKSLFRISLSMRPLPYPCRAFGCWTRTGSL